jgi:hypothetical protein
VALGACDSASLAARCARRLKFGTGRLLTPRQHEPQRRPSLSKALDEGRLMVERGSAGFVDRHIS